MKTIAKLSAILLAAVVSAAWPAMAQPDTTTPSTNAPAAPKPARIPTRYGGMIASIDSTNMMLTLKATTRNPETKVKITSATRVRKDGQPAQFSDAMEGLRISGSGKKGEDGVWTATTLNIVTKPPGAKPPATAAPAAPGQ
jgi:hypothetical protein